MALGFDLPRRRNGARLLIGGAIFLAALVCGIALPQALPELLTAKDYSGFMRGDGYAVPRYVPPEPGLLQISGDRESALLEWNGAAVFQSSPDLIRWSDRFTVHPPHRITLALAPPRQFFRLRQRKAIHSGVDTGLPQQGFEFTGLPESHWANAPATAETCGWIVPELLTGFANLPDDRNPEFVRVVMRSFHDTSAFQWGYEQTLPWDDDPIHQNDGWFHFRVRHPFDPIGIPRDHLLDFEIAWDNIYAFPNNDSLPPEQRQLNEWWRGGYVWDWEEYPGGRHIYTPVYRLIDNAGRAGPWQHFSEDNTFPDSTRQFDERSYRCRFKLVIPAATEWSEIEVAQNLPYSLSDRDEFLRTIQESYLPRHDDLCIRKWPLGYGGLSVPISPDEDPEFNELYAIEIFRKQSGTDATPDLPNDNILLVLAGLDYEPAGNWAAEGIALEILDKWNSGPMFKNHGSYVIIPIGNPDGYEWPSTHTTPYGNGYDDNAIHRGYILLENTAEVPDVELDPEMRALRGYARALDANGLDGSGGNIVALLDLQNDLCPHPRRWTVAGGPLPPIYGGINYAEEDDLTRAKAFIDNMRVFLRRPYTSITVQDHNKPQSWGSRNNQNIVEYGIPLWFAFEFDAAVLYTRSASPPSWMQGGFAAPIELPGPGTDRFWAHGYFDQIGQATAPDGDPAWLFKQLGRDIADAAREVFLPIP